ncbi:MAG TPA: hypothetical protein VLU24_07970 [Mycobacterium sp.]|nr:hypothetical protein [Mycobacterium sp.]
MICADEKTSIQARARKHDTLPAAPSSPARVLPGAENDDDAVTFDADVDSADGGHVDAVIGGLVR